LLDGHNICFFLKKKNWVGGNQLIKLSCIFYACEKHIYIYIDNNIKIIEENSIKIYIYAFNMIIL